MNTILLFLLKKGAHTGPVTISTREMGEALSMSQQNASRLLIILENEGKIKREKNTVLLTPQGINELKELAQAIEHCLSGSTLRLTGKIIDGLGEGKYYVALEGFKSQFNEKLGFDPFLGTLNVRLDAPSIDMRKRLAASTSIVIDGWKEKNRTFGAVFAYPCTVDSVRGAVIIPERTHHGMDILEIIAPVSLRKKLGKKEGDAVRIEIT